MYLPAATQCLVQIDHGSNCRSTVVDIAALLDEQRLLGVEDPLIVGKALLITQHRQIVGALSRGDGLGQDPVLLDGPHVGGHGILHFSGGLQHGLAIGDQSLLQPGILDPYVVADAAIVEKGPEEAPARAVGQTVTVEQITGGGEAQKTGQAEARVERSLCHADLCVQSHRIHFRHAYVRASSQEIGGDSDGKLLGKGRKLAVCVQQPREIARLSSQQRAERVSGQLKCGFECRYRSLGTQQERVRLLQVQG